MRWTGWDSYLIIILLGYQSALSQHEVQGGRGHEHAVAQVTKHDREQEGEGDDGVWRWRQGGRHHMRGGWRHMTQRGGERCRGTRPVSPR